MLSHERLRVFIYVEIPKDIEMRILSSIFTVDESKDPSWDKGLVYEKTKDYLTASIESSKKPARCYDMISLIQLVNGARVSEAVREFKGYLTYGSTTVCRDYLRGKSPRLGQ